MIRVISIDPGYGRCGVAVVEKSKNEKERLVFSECIETNAEDNFVDRLADICEQVRGVIKDHSPSAFAIETLFFNTNQKTAMQVAEVRGALQLIANDNKLPVFEYTPLQIKNATTGYGKSSKRQVVDMLHNLIQIEKEIKHDDEYDAIACGVTCIASEQLNN